MRIQVKNLTSFFKYSNPVWTTITGKQEIDQPGLKTLDNKIFDEFY